MKANGINKREYTILVPWTDCFIAPCENALTLEPEMLKCIFALRRLPVRMLQLNRAMDNMERLGAPVDLVYYSSNGTFYPYDIQSEDYFRALEKEYGLRFQISNNSHDSQEKHNWEAAEDNWKIFLEKYRNKQIIYEYGKRKIYLYSKL